MEPTLIINNRYYCYELHQTINFGKYKDSQNIYWIIKNDPEYIIWLLTTPLSKKIEFDNTEEDVAKMSGLEIDESKKTYISRQHFITNKYFVLSADAFVYLDCLVAQLMNLQKLNHNNTITDLYIEDLLLNDGKELTLQNSKSIQFINKHFSYLTDLHKTFVSLGNPGLKQVFNNFDAIKKSNSNIQNLNFYKKQVAQDKYDNEERHNQLRELNSYKGYTGRTSFDEDDIDNFNAMTNG